MTHDELLRLGEACFELGARFVMRRAPGMKTFNEAKAEQVARLVDEAVERSEGDH